jgi:DNA polymerase III sliding clamp (beta) subunit (PCNA family)
MGIDGHRFSVREKSEAGCDLPCFHIPLGTVKLLPKKGEVRWEIYPNHVVFLWGGFRLESRIMNGRELDWKNFIPGSFRYSAVIPHAELAAALPKGMKGAVRMKFLGDKVHLAGESSSAALACEYTMPEGFEIGFNPNYLREACVGDKFFFEGSSTPIKVLCDNGFEIVFPIRIKW